MKFVEKKSYDHKFNSSHLCSKTFGILFSHSYHVIFFILICKEPVLCISHLANFSTLFDIRLPLAMEEQ